MVIHQSKCLHKESKENKTVSTSLELTMEKNLTVFSRLARKEFVFPQTPVKSDRKQEVIIVADLASSPSLDGRSLLLTGQQVTETGNTLPCVVL